MRGEEEIRERRTGGDGRERRRYVRGENTNLMESKECGMVNTCVVRLEGAVCTNARTRRH